MSEQNKDFDQDDEHYDPKYDLCVWDAGRIEATKTVLFHEALTSGELNGEVPANKEAAAGATTSGEKENWRDLRCPAGCSFMPIESSDGFCGLCGTQLK